MLTSVKGFEVRQLDSTPTLVVRTTVPPARLAETFAQVFREVSDHAERTHARLAGPPFALYHRVGPDAVDLEAGFPVGAPAPTGAPAPAGAPTQVGGRVTASRLPAVTAVVTLHIGPYETLAKTYEALQAWAAERGHALGEVMWESYLSDPTREPDPTNWRTEVVWPLAG